MQQGKILGLAVAIRNVPAQEFEPLRPGRHLEIALQVNMHLRCCR